MQQEKAETLKFGDPVYSLQYQTHLHFDHLVHEYVDINQYRHSEPLLATQEGPILKLSQIE